MVKFQFVDSTILQRSAACMGIWLIWIALYWYDIFKVQYKNPSILSCFSTKFTYTESGWNLITIQNGSTLDLEKKKIEKTKMKSTMSSYVPLLSSSAHHEI